MSHRPSFEALGLIPRPCRCELREGFFPFRSAAQVVIDNEIRLAGESLVSILGSIGWNLVADGMVGEGPVVRISADESLSVEGYRLTVSPHEVAIRASAPAGFFYATQTLRQMLPADRAGGGGTHGEAPGVPCVEIEDEPRFRWRGLMLDVARHFFSVSAIKRFIDLMALHKFNVFHWHLVDDQGWRMEIRRYPELTAKGAWRRESPSRENRDLGDGTAYGGFYTQDEIREIVRYAGERHITVVPEIEMPGHASAAIAAYPALGNFDMAGYHPAVQTRWGIHPYTFSPREETFEFLRNVLAEVMELFPSRYIHIGGDEAPKDQWKESAIAQGIMKQQGIANEEGLQSWFLHRVEAFLNENGRRLVGWDEIQEGGLSPSATMMVWRDWKWARQALSSGNDVIMSPTSHCYLDTAQGAPGTEPETLWGQIPLETVYAFEPVPDGIPPGAEERVLGGQGNVWTECIPDAAHLDYMTYPRACAMAEVFWSPKEARNWEDFCWRLTHHSERLEALGVHFRPLGSK